ncbi:NAD(P)-dependent oxidoreductase [Bradyrhizobium erythrophlei]|uniref:3-hydroxyisobutyrate dehydrogenase n=1 Tax=Bradyrhizobium erythrophlei TaxID=1437360 RepID=A0A1M7U7J2_9BRAD|nr:NAD(P)-dependent oxidoreductase [Bradyrhizobium erythrophlei]SHN78908.1 3-hydroxyisobutyrate dehydrogenase [Bradyrhizobium erythrophlei]
MSVHASIGMIGLGLMGAALSARLIDAGCAVIGFDIDPERCKELKAKGGEVAASVGELAGHCRTIIVAVYNADQVESLLAELAPSEEPARSMIICTTTCTPDEITRIARQADDAGLGFIEAPISGTSAEVRNGSGLALVAGPQESIKTASATLDILCPQRVNVGKIGDASRTKLAINLILQNNRAALAEGIVFAEGLGLDPAVFLATARKSAAYSRVMDTKGDKMLTRDFTPQSHISQTLKDAELILAEAQRRNFSLPLTSTQAALLRTAIALEGPDSDSAAVIEAVRQPKALIEDPT